MQRLRHAGAIAGVIVAAFGTGPRTSAANLSPAPQCDIEGVWEQVSVSFDGREAPPHSRPMRKIVFRGHWMEIGTEADRDKLPQQTEIDKLRATQTFGGAGTYTTTDRSFTQHIDYFTIPSGEGATLTGPCQTDGEYWRYSFSTTENPRMSDGPKQVSEVWRRVR